MTSATPARSDAPAMVFVWDWPLRLFHWALAGSVLVAWFTPSTYDTAHRIAGYTVLGLLAFRLIWGLAGNRFSRLRRYLPLLRALPRYLLNLMRGQPGLYLGLNPAGAAMAVALLVVLAISAVTGWMSVTVRFFGVPWVEDLHSWSSDLVMLLVVVHVLGVVLMCVLQRDNLVRAMITGWKRKRTFGKGPRRR